MRIGLALNTVAALALCDDGHEVKDVGLGAGGAADAAETLRTGCGAGVAEDAKAVTVVGLDKARRVGAVPVLNHHFRAGRAGGCRAKHAIAALGECIGLGTGVNARVVGNNLRPVVDFGERKGLAALGAISRAVGLGARKGVNAFAVVAEDRGKVVDLYRSLGKPSGARTRAICTTVGPRICPTVDSIGITDDVATVGNIDEGDRDTALDDTVAAYTIGPACVGRRATVDALTVARDIASIGDDDRRIGGATIAFGKSNAERIGPGAAVDAVVIATDDCRIGNRSLGAGRAAKAEVRGVAKIRTIVVALVRAGIGRG